MAADAGGVMSISSAKLDSPGCVEDGSIGIFLCPPFGCKSPGKGLRGIAQVPARIRQSWNLRDDTSSKKRVLFMS